MEPKPGKNFTEKAQFHDFKWLGTKSGKTIRSYQELKYGFCKKYFGKMQLWQVEPFFFHKNAPV